jgi:hypothetical protein
VKGVDRKVTAVCSDCPGVHWLETMTSLSSWYCNSDIKSFCKLLFIVKNLFYLDIKECNVVYIATAVIE